MLQNELHRQVRNQRLMLVLSAALVLVIVLGAAFGAFSPDDAGNASNNAPLANQSAGNAGSNSGAQANSGNTNGSNAATANGSSGSAPAKGLMDQDLAKQTESVVILAAPELESLVESNLPAEYRWLPQIVADMGKAFCDRNRAIEAGNSEIAERMLPLYARRGAAFKGYSNTNLLEIAEASSNEHVILVDFQQKMPGFSVRGYSWGRNSREDALATEVQALSGETALASRLRLAICAIAEALTGYDLHADGVWPLDDQQSARFVRLRSELEARDLTPAQATLQDLLKQTPDFQYAEYCYYEAMTRRRAGMSFDDVIQERNRLEVMLYERIQQSGASLRLRNLYATLAMEVLGTQPEREQEIFARGKAVSASIVEEEPLFMHVWLFWQQYHLPLDGPAGARECMKRFPTDGRFHLQLARDLATHPEHAEEAISLADQALKLRPWDSSAYYHRAFACVTIATKLMRAGEEAKATSYFERAQADALSGLQRQPNNPALWLELLVKGLSRDGRSVPPEVSDFTYLCALLAVGLNSGLSNTSQLVLERRYTPKAVESARKWILKEIPPARENPRKVNAYLYLLADVLMAVEAMEKARITSAPVSVSLAAGRRVRDAIRVFREEYGGRITTIETLWENARHIRDEGAGD